MGKTREKEIKIYFSGAHGVEEIDSARSWKEARTLVNEYRLAFNSNAVWAK